MIETLQVDAELEQAERLCYKICPERVLEIGVYQGGTLRVWLENCLSDATVVAVDPAHVYPERYVEWKQPGTQIIVVNGRSQDAESIEAINAYGPYDWIFIDGEHIYDFVKADAELCMPLVREGGVLVFHDIVDSDGVTVYDPGRVVNELEQLGHRVERIVERDVDKSVYDGAHGIGVVYP